MRNDAPGRIRLRASREGDQQCLIRDANEAIERMNVKLTTGVVRLEMRCECGDLACLERVSPTHAEYEAVRAYGSRFIVSVNHENPETAAVISQNERFAVVDVVAGEARYQALARHTRHAWVDAVNPDHVTGHESPARERSPR
jgi:3,4-dihydroxy-2-butanone 4-phosphate synthase